MGGLELWNRMRRILLPQEIHIEQLHPGDHIYTCGQDNRKHHGIYVGDGKVIHLCTRAVVSISQRVCPLCGNIDQQKIVAAVSSTPLHEFLSGGNLYLYKYGVIQAHFGLTRLWEDACTLASSDPPQVVLWRAFFLHYSNYNGCTADHFCYINNGEDFAIYCKTGLLVVDCIASRSRSLQALFFGIITAAVFAVMGQQLFIFSATLFGLLSRCIGIYYVCRLVPDIGVRPNVIKVDRVERLHMVDEILVSAGRESEHKMQKFFGSILPYLFFVFVYSLAKNPRSNLHQGIVLLIPWSFAQIMFFYWAILQRRLLSNEIQKEQLKPGDHIFTYRNVHTYSHHGIYVGDNMVIHLQRGADPISGGGGDQRECRVQSCCIDCFLHGRELCLYKYGVDLAFFMAKIQGGTCTPASADSVRLVCWRARYLLRHGDFGAYNILNNNCEDFAIYCKTRLLNTTPVNNYGTNGQIAAILAVSFSICYCIDSFLDCSYADLAARFYIIYSMVRYGLAESRSDRVPIRSLQDEFRRRGKLFWWIAQWVFYLVMLNILAVISIGDVIRFFLKMF